MAFQRLLKSFGISDRWIKNYFRPLRPYKTGRAGDKPDFLQNVEKPNYLHLHRLLSIPLQRKDDFGSPGKIIVSQK